MSPFDELWTAWGRKQKRPDARHAYKKLAPNDELHATMIEAATAWTANYAAIDRPKDYQKHLSTWIEGECWLEDLPTRYESRTSRAGKAKGKPDAPSGAGGTPTGSHVVQIIGWDCVTADNNDVDFHFSYRVQGGKHDGVEFTDIVPMVNIDGTIDAGCETFLAIRTACDVMEPQSAEDFIGKVLCAIVSKAGIKYGAAGAQPAAGG